MAASVLDKRLTEQARAKGANIALEKREKEGHAVSTNIRETKNSPRVSSQRMTFVALMILSSFIHSTTKNRRGKKNGE